MTLARPLADLGGQVSAWEGIALGFSRCWVHTEDPPSVGLAWPGRGPGRSRPCQSAAEISCREAGRFQAGRQAGEEASPDDGDSRDPSTAGRFPAAAGGRWFRPGPGQRSCAPSFKNEIGICSSRAAGLLRSNRPQSLTYVLRKRVPPVFSEGHEARTPRVTGSGYLRRRRAGTSRGLQRLTIGVPRWPSGHITPG